MPVLEKEVPANRTLTYFFLHVYNIAWIKLWLYLVGPPGGNCTLQCQHFLQIGLRHYIQTRYIFCCDIWILQRQKIMLKLAVIARFQSKPQK